MSFSKEDIVQIENKGLSVEKMEDQLAIFKRGNLSVNIQAAANVGKGIQAIDPESAERFIEKFNSRVKELDVLKFVPASGAATRMFKSLHVSAEEFDPKNQSISEYIKSSGSKDLDRFFTNIEKLPFYKLAYNYAVADQPGFHSMSEEAQKMAIVQAILFSPGLDLSNYPKGLVPFHNYGTKITTAFEEHLYEAAKYASNKGIAKIHFTVSKEHKEKFEAEWEEIEDRVKEEVNVDYNISYSFQDPKTDTLALNDQMEPFRTEEGKLFFRPGGHGALIDNLNNLDADIIFIKNIDNVVTKSSIDEMASWKKVLGGKLLDIQNKCFRYLEYLNAYNLTKDLFFEILEFIEEELYSTVTEDLSSLQMAELKTLLSDRLNRPIRVCGMVKNEGEPGGGPYLVKLENGEISLQIIESSQIDQNNQEHISIVNNATHFNPVDLVCGIKDFKGQKFDLLNYVDPATSFICDKTKDGKSLKALELPGLWNGAMAKWNTIFVEVPVETFNPVKTVSDLLKFSHQPNS